MDQRVIIIRGPFGSGKSTLANRLRNVEEKVTHVKVDSFKDFFADDATIVMDYVNGSANAILKYLLKNEFSVVVEGIFLNSKHIDELLETASQKNVQAKVFEIEITLSELLKRNQQRGEVKESFRDPENIKNLYKQLRDSPYPNSININTEEKTIEECLGLINESFAKL